MKQNIMLYTTKNLAVRQLTVEDVNSLLLLSKQDGCKNFPNEYYETAEEAKEDIETMQSHYQMGHFPFRFAIILKSENRLIGTISLKLTSKREIKISCVMMDDIRRKGYATEAVARMVTYGKERFQKDKLYAFVRSEAKPAQGLLEKVGFTMVEEYEDDFFGQKVLFRRYVI